MADRTVIALGSNLGDRVANLDAAVANIAELEQVSVVTISSWYESIAHTADGLDPDAPRYANGVVIIDTELAPLELLAELQRIEQRLGRPADHQAWSDRVIDLDIVCSTAGPIAEPTLTIPHPRTHERVFVLLPWLEIDATAALFGHGAVADVLAGLDPVERSALVRLEVAR
ncbi:MAG: 2-amino-4-hydroxy-6-hydroxymethyldihydropteridine diphosphokinase [Microbacteriaceae bacterium]